MSIKKILFIIILLFVLKPAIVFASTPDTLGPNPVETDEINSSSFANFVDSMDTLGFEDIHFERPPEQYSIQLNEKFDKVSYLRSAREILDLFSLELNANPHYAYNVYNEALIYLYDLSPSNFKKNSIILKNTLLRILGQPNNPDSKITYTNELDCWDEKNYQSCKKLYQKKIEAPLLFLLMLPIL